MSPEQPWLTVVGIGADGLAGLGERARRALAGASVLVGGARHLELAGPTSAERLPWRSPLADTVADIAARRGRPVVVLATGDPLWFGVGRLLLRHLPRAEVTFLPHLSAFQLAAARLGWALEDTLTLSLHGRPLDALRRHLQPGRRLLVLTENGAAPARIAALLAEAGWGEGGATRCAVLEELGGPGERVTNAMTVAELAAAGTFADLNLVALVLAADGPGLPLVPGLPDESYLHDGQLTKAEVRAATLAALAPLPGQLLWDVGAGAGSVAIEWLRGGGPGMRAVAVEADPTRLARLQANARRLGVPELAAVAGRAPGCLDALAEPPDAVFVGGGLATPGLLAGCWARLRPGGRFVANAVTVAGEAAVIDLHGRVGGRLVRLAVSRAEAMGGQLVWRPALPVTQLSARKSCGAASS